MDLREYLRQQKEEALGPVNRYYCSKHYGRKVDDPETLLRYYIEHGGAEHFAERQRGDAIAGVSDSQSGSKI